MAPRADAYRELTELVDKHARSDGENTTAIDDLFLSRTSSPTQPIHVVQWPCFALVAQGAKSVAVGAEVVEYGVGDFLVVALDLPVVSRVVQATPARPNLGIGLAIDRDRLANVLRRVEPGNLPPAPGTSLCVEVSRASSDLLDATLRLLRLLDRPRDIAVLAPLVEEEILYRLLVGPAGAALLNVACAGSSRDHVVSAARWIREHLATDLSIPALAASVGMSVSSLHHHFKTATGLSPLQYQKQLRLNEARRLLLTERLDVASAGHRVGYRSAAQFSREYARMYGISPRRDVERTSDRSR
ncbi:Transcriptional regulator, AraC family protein [Minicystis rosea]|nr:Transcriptional regulator, AraC family protein [Minicystis rosea]